MELAALFQLKPLSFSVLYCLCQLLVPNASFEVPCNQGWIANKYSGTCIKQINEKKSYDDARAFCKASKADLLKVLDSKMLGSVMTDVLKRTAGEYFIGLKKTLQQRDFTWLDDDTPADYLKWNSNFWPTGEQQCGILKSPDYFFEAGHCGDPHNFICEQRVVELCPSGWLASPHSGTCVKLYQTLSTWQEGRAQCRADGGDLVTILNDDMNHFLSDQTIKDVGNKYYHGLNDLKQEGDFRWLDYVENVNFTRWNTLHNEPDNRLNQDCGEINNKDFNPLLWTDGSCDEKWKFICEKYADCDKERYGMVCPKTCSPHCAGAGDDCNPRTGSCNFGCDRGYTGLTCPPVEVGYQYIFKWTVFGSLGSAAFLLPLLLCLYARSPDEEVVYEGEGDFIMEEAKSIGQSSHAASEGKAKSTASSKPASVKSEASSGKSFRSGDTPTVVSDGPRPSVAPTTGQEAKPNVAAA